MKRILVLLFTSSLTYIAYSQNEDCSCKEDLIFLDNKIQKTPAYKTHKKLYELAYSELLKKAESINTLYDCQILLNSLLLSLNDNHCKVYGADTGATDEIKSAPDKFAEFKNTKIFNTYPKPDMNLDSLKTVLESKTKEDKEGIYSIDHLTIGVFKSKNENNFKAIVVNSESEVWVKGEIIYTLIPFGKNYLLCVGGSLSSKRLIAYTERIENGFFYFMGFQKDINQTNFSTKTLSENTYYREELSDEITYLKVGSFDSWYPTLSDAEKFYKSLESNLNKSNLIVDLRNNGGGGERNSNILYKLLKDYAKKNRIYVLLNHRTISNAEQFAQKLKKLENCQIFGIRTNGTLAYEIKDSTYDLPCGNFIAVLTSKKHSEYIEFESQGIEPDVKLTMKSDWIIQLKNYIAENYKS